MDHNPLQPNWPHILAPFSHEQLNAFLLYLQGDLADMRQSVTGMTLEDRLVVIKYLQGIVDKINRSGNTDVDRGDNPY